MKTAVEWLVEQITNGTMSAREAIQQAKEMEKEQIMDAHIDGSNEGLRFTGSKLIKTAEQYYNQTFKSEWKQKNN